MYAGTCQKNCRAVSITDPQGLKFSKQQKGANKSDMDRIMAIDYGDARVGVAVSDLLGITAQGVETIKNTGKRALFTRLAELIETYKPSVIVIGLPKNMNGTLGERAQKSIEFEHQIKQIYAGRTELFDERLTDVYKRQLQRLLLLQQARLQYGV